MSMVVMTAEDVKYGGVGPRSCAAAMAIRRTFPEMLGVVVGLHIIDFRIPDSNHPTGKRWSAMRTPTRLSRFIARYDRAKQNKPPGKLPAPVSFRVPIDREDHQ